MRVAASVASKEIEIERGRERAPIKRWIPKFVFHFSFTCFFNPNKHWLKWHHLRQYIRLHPVPRGAKKGFKLLFEHLFPTWLLILCTIWYESSIYLTLKSVLTSLMSTREVECLLSRCSFSRGVSLGDAWPVVVMSEPDKSDTSKTVWKCRTSSSTIRAW